MKFNKFTSFILSALIFNSTLIFAKEKESAAIDTSSTVCLYSELCTWDSKFYTWHKLKQCLPEDAQKLTTPNEIIYEDDIDPEYSMYKDVCARVILSVAFTPSILLIAWGSFIVSSELINAASESETFGPVVRFGERVIHFGSKTIELKPETFRPVVRFGGRVMHFGSKAIELWFHKYSGLSFHIPELT